MDCIIFETGFTLWMKNNDSLAPISKSHSSSLILLAVLAMCPYIIYTVIYLPTVNNISSFRGNGPTNVYAMINILVLRVKNSLLLLARKYIQFVNCTPITDHTFTPGLNSKKPKFTFYKLKQTNYIGHFLHLRFENGTWSGLDILNVSHINSIPNVIKPRLSF